LSEHTERFVALVHEPPERIRLDVAALLVATHAHPTLDLAARLDELDRLAADVPRRDAAGVAEALCGAGGFTGNTIDYYDPANSYLDDVLDRRLGIPISLSVLMIEVGRRAGVTLVGVGMPGHFLVGVPGGDGSAPDEVHRWYDPFHGPAPLGFAECAALYAQVHAGAGHAARLVPEQLAAVGPLAILDRMLGNLQQTLLRRSPAAAAWPTRLRLTLPDVPPGRRAELALTLGDLGQFSEAAAALDAVACDLDPAAADRAVRAAAQLRARAN
jgi:regulator of sirC expression with transglutaminase-like and TPR domain